MKQIAQIRRRSLGVRYGQKHLFSYYAGRSSASCRGKTDGPVATAGGSFCCTARRVLTDSCTSLRACGEVFGQVAGEQVIEVYCGAWAFIDAVGAIGIGHEVEAFPEIRVMVKNP